MKNVKKGFPPIANKWAEVLILGSMPGEESLRKNEYYANPRNIFWRIMAALFGFGQDTSYEERIRILKKNEIALWDVMKSCERRGSLDSAIKDSAIIENDFVSFYRSHPKIRYVFFNGAKSEREYKKRVLQKLSNKGKEIICYRLPSTSPAMARLSFDEKLIEWSKIKRITDSGRGKDMISNSGDPAL
jgi:TDG/mug DNA glycosylase family protein